MMGLDLLFIMFLVALVASFCDAIAGGGGLLTLPALLLASVEPVSALATNKLQASVGSVSAALTFIRKGIVSWRKIWPMALSAGIGSLLGALSVNLLPPEVLKGFVPILLIAVALYFIFSPKLSDLDGQPKMSAFAFGLTVVPAIGFYDGIFGPGTGSFLTLGFVSLMGYGIIKSIGHTKVLNAATNLGALLVFLTYGKIIWALALAMAAGSFIGAQLGARFAMKAGAKVVKPMLITICCLMAIKLLMEADHPIRLFFAQLF
ncbi:MAG: TSUP family transporter [Neisseriaceae bacterium]|nr:TSUP family transporter [Neisseriaceae bacterium]